MNTLCFLLGHKYYVAKEYSRGQRKLVCRRCKMAFAMHDGLRALLPWDGDFAELYRELENPK